MGALLTAARDATIVFYNIDRDAEGEIVDIFFNLRQTSFDGNDIVSCIVKKYLFS